MPVIARHLSASATENALTNLRFSRPKSPALISIWAATATANETFSFGVDDVVLAESVPVNTQAADGVVDTSRDQVMFREPAPAGEYYLAIPAMTADFNFLINQEIV